jgi:hypothetical protein
MSAPFTKLRIAGPLRKSIGRRHALDLVVLQAAGAAQDRRYRRDRRNRLAAIARSRTPPCGSTAPLLGERHQGDHALIGFARSRRT